MEQMTTALHTLDPKLTRSLGENVLKTESEGQQENGGHFNVLLRSVIADSDVESSLSSADLPPDVQQALLSLLVKQNAHPEALATGMPFKSGEAQGVEMQVAKTVLDDSDQLDYGEANQTDSHIQKSDLLSFSALSSEEQLKAFLQALTQEKSAEKGKALPLQSSDGKSSAFPWQGLLLSAAQRIEMNEMDGEKGEILSADVTKNTSEQGQTPRMKVSAFDEFLPTLKGNKQTNESISAGTVMTHHSSNPKQTGTSASFSMNDLLSFLQQEKSPETLAQDKVSLSRPPAPLTQSTPLPSMMKLPTDLTNQVADVSPALLSKNKTTLTEALANQVSTAETLKQSNLSALVKKANKTSDTIMQSLPNAPLNSSTLMATKADISSVQMPVPLAQSIPERAEALAERINTMLAKNIKQVDIRLDPPELGRMQIKLGMFQDQASVQFMVGNAAARELVEQSIPRLREMFQQQGLQLAQTQVDQGETGASERGASGYFGGQSSQANSLAEGTLQHEPAAEDELSVSMSSTTPSILNSGIDDYA